MISWLKKLLVLSLIGTGTLLAAPPDNDTCSGAVLLTENVEYTQLVTNATPEAFLTYSSVVTNKGGVCFRYIPPIDGALVFSTRVSTVEIFVGFTGSCPQSVVPSLTSRFVRAGQELLFCSMPDKRTNQISVRIFTAPRPANDDCANAIPLAENVTVAGDLTGAADDPGYCGGVQSVWYTYTPPWSGTTRVDMVAVNDQFYHDGGAYTGTCGALSTVACSSTALFDRGFPTVGGKTYTFVLGHYSGRASPFQVRISTTPPPPANDDCATAEALSEGVYATRLTLAGHDDTGLVAGVISRGTWFSYTPAFSGIAHLDTCPSDFGTKLEVFSGPCFALQPVATVDQSASCGGLRAAVSFACAAGVTYRICAGGTNGAAGNLYLLAESEPLTNNMDCAAAGVLFDRQPLVQNTAGFPDAPSTCAGTIPNAAWFVYTAPLTGTARVETCGSEFATLVEAFDGGCSNLVSLGCANASSACSNRAALSFPCSSGVTYRICAGGAPNGGLLRIVVSARGRPALNDFDGDGRSDLGHYFSQEGAWRILRSNGGQWKTNELIVTKFGFFGTRLLEGDFDGDGVADYALYESKTYRWFLGRSQAGYTNFTFGYMGTTPVTADFDGDGRTDIAIFEPARGRWSVRNSTTGPTNVTYGVAGSMPAVADFDGDGRADFGYYRPDDGLWRVQLSGGGTLQTNFGAMLVFDDGTTDRGVPLPADYDGDGLADLAVRYGRATTDQLRIRLTSLGRTNLYVGAYDTTRGDFDGDGARDIAWASYESGLGFLQADDLAGAAFRLPLPGAASRNSYHDQVLGDPRPILERQFSWRDNIRIGTGRILSTPSGKTATGRSFRIQLPEIGKRTGAVFIDSSGASAPLYLSGIDGSGFADSPGTAATGPISMTAAVTKVDGYPIPLPGLPLGFISIDYVTVSGAYRDQRGETTMSFSYYQLSIASL